MTRWRKRAKESGMEKLLGETINAGLDIGVSKKSSMNKGNVDTTVQEKAISSPYRCEAISSHEREVGSVVKRTWSTA